MHFTQRALVCTFGILVLASVSVGQEYAAELRRGRGLLEDLAKRPLKPHKVFAEAVVNSQVVGFVSIQVEPGDKDPIQFKYDMVIHTLGVRLCGAVRVVANQKLQPKRIEFGRAVRRFGGKTATERKIIDVVDGQLRVSDGEGDRRKVNTKPLPEGPFVFSADALFSRMEAWRGSEPFAVHELNPDRGEIRLLVFRPSAGEDGTQIVNVLVDGTKPEAVYRFSRDGKLVSWSEAGAPITMKVVDEKRGAALIKRKFHTLIIANR